MKVRMFGGITVGAEVTSTPRDEMVGEGEGEGVEVVAGGAGEEKRHHKNLLNGCRLKT